MPDIEELREHHRFAPPAGGVEAAVVKGRRRRRVRHSAQAAAALAAVLVGVTVVPTGSGSSAQDVLLPAKDPGQQSSVSADPSTSAPPVAPQPIAPARSTVAIAGPAVVASPRPPAHRQDPHEAAAGPRRTASPYAPVIRQYAAGAAPNGCVFVPRTTVFGRESGGDSCSTAVAVRTGTGWELGLNLCRSAASVGTDTYRFDTTREIALHVKQGTAAKWSWDRDRDGADSRHSVALQPGDCLQWRTPWRAVDDQNRPLPPGGYTLGVNLDRTNSKVYEIQIRL